MNMFLMRRGLCCAVLSMSAARTELPSNEIGLSKFNFSMNLAYEI
jgi:hypothetical protein